MSKPGPTVASIDGLIPEESTLDKLISYVMHTPHNINPAILIQLVRDVVNDPEMSNIFNPGEPLDPDLPGDNQYFEIH